MQVRFSFFSFPLLHCIYLFFVLYCNYGFLMEKANKDMKTKHANRFALKLYSENTLKYESSAFCVQ